MNPKPCLFTVFLLILFNATFAQISDFLHHSSFDWSYWEIYDNDQEKSEFLSKSGLQTMNAATVKIVDIDGNQIPDVISISGGNTLVLMRNMGSAFETILELDETLIMVGRPKPWNPVYLLTRDDNCCDPGFYSLNYYRPGFDQTNKLTYVFDKSIIVQKDVELISENLPPFRFELKSDLSLHVNADPASSEIGKYMTNASGFAVASKVGTDGRTWWLVLMPVETHSLKAGWMPSNDLKRKF
jgi:hypothetical protein